MIRPIAALTAALLAASPAAALSVSASACNEDSAELISTGSRTTLTVNGADVALEPGFDYRDLVCVSRNDETLFGIIRLSPREEESYLLLDPETLELSEITEAEATRLDLFQDEDDWELGLLDDEDEDEDE